MKNPLTFRVESWVGSVVVLAFAAFLVGTCIVAVKNFISDSDVLVFSSDIKLKPISAEEKGLIDDWLASTNSSISVKDVGYRYIIKKYPGRPWLSR